MQLYIYMGGEDKLMNLEIKKVKLPLESFSQLRISKFIYLPSLHMYKVLSKSEFSCLRGSLVNTKQKFSFE